MKLSRKIGINERKKNPSYQLGLIKEINELK